MIDVLDFHAYPSERGDNPISKIDVKSTKRDMQVRLQAPRRFWDPEYTEVYDPDVNQWDKWIIDYFHQFLPILPPMFASIDKFNPGTKLAITEFQIGGYEDISGTIALADILGIFGKYGVYAANHWGKPGHNGFLAYDLFRNYDGKNSTFGDTYVKADMYNPDKDKFQTSVYASVNGGNTDELHIITMNKNLEKNLIAEFNIDYTEKKYNEAEVYYVKSVSDEEREEGWREIIKKDDTKIEIVDNKFKYTLPRLSVVHIIIK